MSSERLADDLSRRTLLMQNYEPQASSRKRQASATIVFYNKTIQEKKTMNDIDKKIETQSFNNLTALEENIKNLDDAQLSAEIADLVLDASDTALKKVLKILIQDQKKSLDPDLIDQDVFDEN